MFPTYLTALLAFLSVCCTWPADAQSQSQTRSQSPSENQSQARERAQYIAADTLYQLQEITVEATRLSEPRKHQPVQVYVVDSLALASLQELTLDSALERYTGLYLRNHGPSGTSTVSQRGMMSHQTLVLWNGFNINNPTLGLADFSTIGADMFSEIHVGSTASASYGSGTIGGHVDLKSGRAGEGVYVSQSVGSWQRYLTRTGGSASGEDWHVNARGAMEYSENDYPFEDRTAVPVETRPRENNHVESFHGLVDAAYTAGRTEWAGGLWLGDRNSGVPGSITNLTPDAEQQDRYLRSFVSMRREHEALEYGLRAFRATRQLDFQEPSISLDSRTGSRDHEIEAPMIYRFNERYRLQAAAGWRNTVIHESTNFDHQPERDQVHVRVNPLLHPLESLRIYPALRLDHYSDFGEALSYSLGVNYEAFEERLFLRASASRDFNAPTFNDLFWPDTGNPDLQPERGLKLETGFLLQLHEPVIQQLDLQLYTSRMEDGIQWLPGQNGFSPENIREIRARGFDLESQSSGRHAGIRWTVRNILTGTWSQYAAERFDGDGSVGNQLTHTPKWQYRGHLDLQRGPLSVAASYRWTGRRYTTSDNTRYLDPYRVVDLSAGWRLNSSYGGIQLRADVQNLLDRHYEVVHRYPMPARTYMLTLRLQR